MAWNSLIWLLLALLVSAPVQAAKLYKWVDERGNITYLDHPPPEGQGRVEEKTLRLKPGGDEGDPSSAAAAAKFPVTLYMTPRCSPCDAVRAHLKRRKIPFTEIDVSEKNPQAQEEMRQKVQEVAVPTITVGSKIMRGYIDSLLDGELDQAGYPKLPVKPEGEPAAETTTGAP